MDNSKNIGLIFGLQIYMLFHINNNSAKVFAYNNEARGDSIR
jgi:hypothetical protein